MNLQAIRILFLKDLFLSRRHLFAYFAGGMISSALTCVPNPTFSFIGFLLTVTVAIASGIHLIGLLLLSESTDQTRLFIFSLPVSLLDYSIGKMAVVMTTYLIPWSAMLACTTILTVVLPWEHKGAAAVAPVIFCFLLSTFTVQLVTAVASESVGVTICMLVGCNVALNIFLMKLFAISEVTELAKSNSLGWLPVLSNILLVELLVVVAAFASALLLQSRKRDLI